MQRRQGLSDIRSRVLALLQRRPDIKTGQIGVHTGLSHATVNKFINGTFTFGPRVDAEFERVLREIEAGDILPEHTEEIAIPKEPSAIRRRSRRARDRDFYVIDSVRKIEQVLNHCAEQGVIGVVTGDYGIGKTEAIRRWIGGAGSTVNQLVFEFDEFSSRNVVDFVHALADKLNLRADRSVKRGGETMRNVCAAIAQQEPPLLMIFDQCETCSPRVMQVIRQIWDKTRDAGTGIALFASPLLLHRLNAARMKDMGALSSRVAIWTQLRGVLREESMNVLKQEGVTDIDPDALDLLWRASGGSMRRLMAAADLLVLKHSGKRITVRTVEGVASHLWGLDIASNRKVATA
jgi:type II secretory pathway predicted ATPase ExeA